MRLASCAPPPPRFCPPCTCRAPCPPQTNKVGRTVAASGSVSRPLPQENTLKPIFVRPGEIKKINYFSLMSRIWDHTRRKNNKCSRVATAAWQPLRSATPQLPRAALYNCTCTGVRRQRAAGGTADVYMALCFFY